MSLLINVVLYALIPLLHGFFWYWQARSNAEALKCNQIATHYVAPRIVASPCHTLPDQKSPIMVGSKSTSDRQEFHVDSVCDLPLEADLNGDAIITVDSDLFDVHRAEFLAPMTYKHSKTYLVNSMKPADMHNRRRLQLEPIREELPNEFPKWEDNGCRSLWQTYVALSKGICQAVVRVDDTYPNTQNAYQVLRFDSNVDELGHEIDVVKTLSKEILARPSYTIYPNEYNQFHKGASGYYRKIPQFKGRNRLIEKLDPLLKNFESINTQLDEKLQSHNIKQGDDVVVMVINEGEVDLYYNFVCSCKLHTIDISNVLVFSGSPEIIPIIEASGAMGLYHEGYSFVSKQASADYLDRIFVDMMWYKAFSIYLLLRKRINILFQDTDLVWFRDPFQYIHEYRGNITERSKLTGSVKEAFFSDDGQRALRYAPFYGNSGFYYLVANERSEYFSWSIMTAFDTVQRLGSHQNVLTTRIVEGLGLSLAHAKILPIDEFPTGMLYHHDPKYMKKLYDHEIQPYGFHMCWTQGKPDKLIYLKKANMWYLNPTCSDLEAYQDKGVVYTSAVKISKGLEENNLNKLCCVNHFTSSKMP